MHASSAIGSHSWSSYRIRRIRSVSTLNSHMYPKSYLPMIFLPLENGAAWPRSSTIPRYFSHMKHPFDYLLNIWPFRRHCPNTLSFSKTSRRRSQETHSQRLFVNVLLRMQLSFSNKAGGSFGVSLLDSIPHWMISYTLTQEERRWQTGSLALFIHNALDSPGADQHERCAVSTSNFAQS